MTSSAPNKRSPASFIVQAECPLPAGMQVFERGWLSANGVLFQGPEGSALVDTGYCTHSSQTVALARNGLGGRELDLILNTHLHSDHCGGNAALQQEYPAARTLIPPGLADFVRQWDPVALSYTPTGQECPRFRFEGMLVPGQQITLGSSDWQIHAAPGHDPHSVILFAPASRTLISADALWENGFGIVFDELEGIEAFDEVAATLDLIESLGPVVVVPGHGPVFTDAGAALAAARSRLKSFVADPARHARHAAKVLLKFKLLDLQQIRAADFQRWALGNEYLGLVHRRYAAESALADWIDGLTSELVRSGAARRDGALILNA
ncbi:MBL fold metallo-hydrolase [Caenimonas terrae]|uniref:MBL fold metallo-hydrolase n=1 Tax=Caenimonas terrae TaxID=696074 RepID=A0ABW0NJI9_9BURK